MKKLITILLLATLPSLSYSKDSDFIVAYAGILVLSNLDVISFSKTTIYKCNINKLGPVLCKAKVENDAIEACKKSMRTYLKQHKQTHKLGLCHLA